MSYTDKNLEDLVIPLRKLFNEGKITEDKFYELRKNLESEYTSLNAFFKSLDQDMDVNLEDSKSYFIQYFDQTKDT